ncbi:phage terminase large subunit family protein [Burkholderia cepacia]|uniref:phage terminase large subunit family protein n=1 Tax=Burkholderia cepacia TaxID=292 RepID=UPI001CF38415|nr:phage terminase large subunit family protein [Burkholderia cepacia]MCA8026490.1 phage terminase large subunit family protein [Burkholderia cepacia]
MTEQATQHSTRRYARGYDALHAGLLAARRENLLPPPKLSLSEWAERYAVLSRETSAQTGRFRAFGYQRGMLDAVTDPAVEKISVMKSARVGYTKLMDHAVGYFIHQDPSPILVVQPRVEDAESYSKTEIAPMLRDTPVLATIAGDQKAKNSDQTILAKTFRNGSSLTLVGANSPAGFRRITSRVVMFDEVDAYPVDGAGNEGDQIALGTKRSETFWNRKIVLGSTPTVKGFSRIEKSFDESDQRRFYVPCPHCGEFQVLEWGGPDTPHGMKWDKDADGNGIPSSVYYVCRHNGCIINEADKPEMVDAGEWRATKPFNGHAGFHIWAGYSLFPNACWSNLVAEWLRVKDDPLARQTFINLVLGEPYEDRGDRALSEARLAARTEVWAAEVPDGVGVVTVGGDVQDDRVELETIGWGRNEESWSIDHAVIEGDPESADLWAKVDAYLKRVWRRADGRGFEVMAACIDSGGHHTQKVYEFAKARLGRRVWAVKGESARGGARSPVWPTKRPSSRNKASFRPVIIGVNAAKDVIRDRLRRDPQDANGVLTYPAGYMHFPSDRDINYFAQLISERSVTKVANGQKFRVWELPPGRANEALDIRVYGYAALCGLMHMGLKLNRRVEAVEIDPTQLIEPAPNEPTVTDLDVVRAERPTRPDGPVIKQEAPVKKTRIRRLAGARAGG